MNAPKDISDVYLACALATCFCVGKRKSVITFSGHITKRLVMGITHRCVKARSSGIASAGPSVIDEEFPPHINLFVLLNLCKLH